MRVKYFLRNINGEHMRWISKAEGEDMCEGGQAARIYAEREHGKPNQSAASRLIGYKLRFVVHPPDPGQPTLKKSDMLANAGVYGSSYTANLSEREKLTHTRKTRYASGVEVETLEPEDFVELAEAKVTLWPLIGDTRAVRVGPRVDERAMELAADLAREQRLYPAP